jgi:hypothetical protein
MPKLTVEQKVSALKMREAAKLIDRALRAKAITLEDEAKRLRESAGEGGA